jgi:hypothetical protein
MGRLNARVARLQRRLPIDVAGCSQCAPRPGEPPRFVICTEGDPPPATCPGCGQAPPVIVLQFVDVEPPNAGA